MSKQKIDPQMIFDNLIDEFNELLKKLSENRTEEMRDVYQTAESVLINIKNETNAELIKLKEVAEWNTLTIAMYGETNAGKSTLIEYLRIAYQEDSKKENSLAFQQQAKELGLTENNLQKLKQQEQQIRQNIEIIEQKFKHYLQEYTQKLNKVLEKFTPLNDEYIKQTLIKKSDVEYQLSKQKEQYNKYQQQFQVKKNNIYAQITALEMALSNRVDSPNIFYRLFFNILYWFIEPEEEWQIIDLEEQFEDIKSNTNQKLTQLRAKAQPLQTEYNYLINCENFLYNTTEYLNNNTAKNLEGFLSLLTSFDNKNADLWQKYYQELLDLKNNEEVFQQKIAIEKGNLIKQLTDIKNQQQQIYQQSKKLNYLADGHIIGTGESDFTKDNTVYSFNINGKPINIIDVPGIEGNESIVINAVWEAVRRAHIVFYITPKPMPPQKGDGEKGTLEKIKEHLAQHTEVYAIYNKKVLNYRSIKNKGLLSDDEKRSLKVMDRKLTEQLGTAYKHHLAISARPAFLMVSDNALPFSDIEKEKEKFLKKAPAEEILKAVNVHELQKVIENKLEIGTKEIITTSNVNKANLQLIHAIAEIEKLLILFHSQAKQIAEQSKTTCRNIKNIQSTIKKDLKSSVDKSIETFCRNLRNPCYRYIDNNDVSSSDVERYFKEQRERARKKFESSMKSSMKSYFTDFQNSIQEILEHHNNQMIDINKVYSAQYFNKNMGGGFNISSGINPKTVTATIATIVGITAIIMGGLTGMGLVIASVSVLISAFTAIRSFFDTKYKKAKQKESIDKNISKIKKKLDKETGKKLDKSNEKIDEIVLNIINTVKNDANKAKKLCIVLEESRNKLNKLSMKIEELI